LKIKIENCALLFNSDKYNLFADSALLKNWKMSNYRS